MLSSIRAAYSGSKYNDRFEAVGIANLDREDLTHVFRGPCQVPHHPELAYDWL